MNYFTEDEKKSREIWDTAVEYRDKDKIEKEKKEKESISLFKFENCKMCNTPVKLSCKYDGNYPLCYIHRDPNDRIKNNTKKQY